MLENTQQYDDGFGRPPYETTKFPTTLALSAALVLSVTGIIAGAIAFQGDINKLEKEYTQLKSDWTAMSNSYLRVFTGMTMFLEDPKIESATFNGDGSLLLTRSTNACTQSYTIEKSTYSFKVKKHQNYE